MLQYFPESAKTVLDVGCGEGSFAYQLKQKHQTETWGIEYMPEHAKLAEDKLDKVMSGPCEDYIEGLPDQYFDVIYFNDVLEHLVDPYWVLEKMKSKLTNQGIIISSIPNMRYHKPFVDLVLNKNWEYKDSGIMDRTHLRFFTKKSIVNMYQDLGYTVVKHEGINKTKSIKPYLYNILFLFTATDMFYVQYATVVKK